MPRYTVLFDPRPPNGIIVHGIRNATIVTPGDVPYQVTMARIECNDNIRQALLNNSVTYWDDTLGLSVLPGWMKRQGKVWHEWQGHPLQEQPFPLAYSEEGE